MHVNDSAARRAALGWRWPLPRLCCGAGETDAYGLYLQLLFRRVRSRRHHQGALRGDLRLHARMGDERRRRHAPVAPQARRQGTKADVVLGLDNNLMAEAEATGLFCRTGSTPPGSICRWHWTDQTFLPFDWGWFAFVYDKTRLATPPRASTALVDAKDGPAIVIEDPRTSTPGLGLLLWVKQVYGDKAAGGLEEARAENRDGDRGLVGGLRPLPEGRGRHGALLHDLARLPHRGGGQDPIQGRGFLPRGTGLRSRSPA